MTVEPPPDYREEVDIVRIDPLFLERQRNRYASRGVAFLVILNGVAALILLASFVRLSPQIENAPKVRLAQWWCSAPVSRRHSQACFSPTCAAPSDSKSAACFVVGLRMVGTAVVPTLVSSATLSKPPARGEPGPQGLPGPAGPQGAKGKEGRAGSKRREGGSRPSRACRIPRSSRSELA